MWKIRAVYIKWSYTGSAFTLKISCLFGFPFIVSVVLNLFLLYVQIPNFKTYYKSFIIKNMTKIPVFVFKVIEHTCLSEDLTIFYYLIATTVVVMYCDLFI